jgi:endonuclease/exonuclease/phosphatase (EEP) superfamily protein YafD
MAIQAIAWACNVFGWNTGREAESTRLLFWNVCRGNLGYDAIAREIAAVDPGIVALVEATRQGQDSGFWNTALPGYSATCLGAGMTLLVRNGTQPVEVEIIEKGQVPGECRYRVLVLDTGEQRLRLLIADIKSSPLMFRRPAFARLASIAARSADLPSLVVGDFNTPLDSVHVDLLRDDLANAFESSGTGYRETWPVILPVLSLDQIWGNSGVTWHRCWCESSLRSDHRRVVAEFSIAAD